MSIDPEDYGSTPAFDLLEAAARGAVGIDRRWLHALVDDPAKSTPDLLRFAASDYGRYPINLQEELIDIFHYLGTPEAIPFYLAAIREEPFDASDALVQAVAAFRERMLEPLLALYEELGEENSGDTAFLLVALNVRDPRILPLLIDRLEYDLQDALFCMEVYGDAAAIPAIQSMAGKVDDEELQREIKKTLEALAQPKPATHDTPFDIFESFPDIAEPVFDVLSPEERLEMLSSRSAERRAQAAAGFFGEEFSTETRAKLLDLTRNDPEAFVRARAWEALSDYSTEPVLRRAMVERLQNADTPPIEKGGLVVALFHHTDQPEVRRAIEALVALPETRAKALEAMWRSLDPAFNSYPPKHLDSEDEAVRRAAIWGIGHLQLGREVARLVPLFKDEVFRADALHAYALASPGETSRARIRSRLARVEELSGGLTEDEQELVKMALDQRLMMEDLKPVFFVDEEDEVPARVATGKVGRNDPCPCGSGKKYKKCCGAQ